MLIVKDLIEKLQEYPEDMRAILDGYEGGYTDVHDFEEVEILLNVINKEWYYGVHEPVRTGATVEERALSLGNKK